MHRAPWDEEIRVQGTVLGAPRAGRTATGEDAAMFDVEYDDSASGGSRRARVAIVAIAEAARLVLQCLHAGARVLLWGCIINTPSDEAYRRLVAGRILVLPAAVAA